MPLSLWKYNFVSPRKWASHPPPQLWQQGRSGCASVKVPENTIWLLTHSFKNFRLVELRLLFVIFTIGALIPWTHLRSWSKWRRFSRAIPPSSKSHLRFSCHPSRSEPRTGLRVIIIIIVAFIEVIIITTVIMMVVVFDISPAKARRRSADSITHPSLLKILMSNCHWVIEHNDILCEGAMMVMNAWRC